MKGIGARLNVKFLRKKIIKAKKCELCGKAVRQENKCGKCSNCYLKTRPVNKYVSRRLRR